MDSDNIIKSIQYHKHQDTVSKNIKKLDCIPFIACISIWDIFHVYVWDIFQDVKLLSLHLEIVLKKYRCINKFYMIKNKNIAHFYMYEIKISEKQDR